MPFVISSILCVRLPNLPSRCHVSGTAFDTSNTWYADLVNRGGTWSTYSIMGMMYDPLILSRGIRPLEHSTNEWMPWLGGDDDEDDNNEHDDSDEESPTIFFLLFVEERWQDWSSSIVPSSHRLIGYVVQASPLPLSYESTMISPRSLQITKGPPTHIIFGVSSTSRWCTLIFYIWYLHNSECYS